MYDIDFKTVQVERERVVTEMVDKDVVTDVFIPFPNSGGLHGLRLHREPGKGWTVSVRLRSDGQWYLPNATVSAWLDALNEAWSEVQDRLMEEMR